MQNITDKQNKTPNCLQWPLFIIKILKLDENINIVQILFKATKWGSKEVFH